MLDTTLTAGEKPETFAEGEESRGKDLPHKMGCFFTASLRSVSIICTIIFQIENVSPIQEINIYQLWLTAACEAA